MLMTGQLKWHDSTQLNRKRYMRATLEAIMLILMETSQETNAFQSLKCYFKFHMYAPVKNKPGPQIIKAVNMYHLDMKGPNISYSLKKMK